MRARAVPSCSAAQRPIVSSKSDSQQPTDGRIEDLRGPPQWRHPAHLLPLHPQTLTLPPRLWLQCVCHASRVAVALHLHHVEVHPLHLPACGVPLRWGGVEGRDGRRNDVAWRRRQRSSMTTNGGAQSAGMEPGPTGVTKSLQFSYVLADVTRLINTLMNETQQELEQRLKRRRQRPPIVALVCLDRGRSSYRCATTTGAE